MPRNFPKDQGRIFAFNFKNNVTYHFKTVSYCHTGHIYQLHKSANFNDDVDVECYCVDAIWANRRRHEMAPQVQMVPGSN